MASNLKYSNGTRDAQQNGLITYAGTGAIISIYQGTQPANANTAIRDRKSTRLNSSH